MKKWQKNHQIEKKGANKGKYANKYITCKFPMQYNLLYYYNAMSKYY